LKWNEKKKLKTTIERKVFGDNYFEFEAEHEKYHKETWIMKKRNFGL
jgi:hypothetical protein